MVFYKYYNCSCLRYEMCAYNIIYTDDIKADFVRFVRTDIL